MKFLIKITNYCLPMIVICQLTFSSPVLAANYSFADKEHEETSIIGNLDISDKITTLGDASKLPDEYFFSFDKNKNYLLVADFLKQKQYEKARNKITVLLIDTPTDSNLYILQAQLNILEKKDDFAKQDYLKALELNQVNAQAYIGLAKLALDEGALGQAENYCSKILAINNQNPDAYILLAKIAYKQNNKLKAEEILLSAKKKVKGNIKSELKLATVLVKMYAIQKLPEKTLILGQEIVNQYPNNSEALSILAGAQIVNNKKQAAEQTLKQLINLNPNEPSIYNLKAQLEIVKGEKNLAKLSYQKAISLDHDNKLAHFGLAKLAIIDKQFNDAKRYCNDLLTINDSYLGARILLAEIAFKQGNNQEAENILLAAYEKVHGSIVAEIELVTMLGRFYVVHKKTEKFLSLSKELTRRYSNNSLALSVLANAQLANNKKLLAEKTLQQIINQEKQDIKHRIILAKLLSKKLDREQDVLKLLDEVFELKPNSVQSLKLKTHYLIKLKHNRQALDTANKTIQLFPKSPLGSQLKGDVYLADEKISKAIEAYQQAYRIKPNIKLLFVMTSLMRKQGESTAAITLLESELEKNNKNLALHFKLGVAYQQLNNYKQAEKYYKTVLSEQNNNVLALNNLAWVYAQQNMPRALELGLKAYKLAPQSIAVADTYGYILVKQGNIEQGLKVLQTAAIKAPEANDIQFHLAIAYSLSGDNYKAISILEKLRAKTDPFTEKKNAEELLLKLKKQVVQQPVKY